MTQKGTGVLLRRSIEQVDCSEGVCYLMQRIPWSSGGVPQLKAILVWARVKQAVRLATMSGLRVPAGISALSLGLVYIAAFVYFGAFFSYPASGTPDEKMRFLSDHQWEVSLVYFSIYVLFGVLLAILVVGVHETLKSASPPMASLASIFGVVWVGLVIASGMIFTIGLDQAVHLLGESPDAAFALWRTVSVVANSLGGGNEIVGGLWVLLVSLTALQARVLSRALNYLGCFVGIAGIATVYPEELFTEVFGLSQIVWFIWLGVVMLRSGTTSAVTT